MIKTKNTIIFVSSIDEDWGGSEELWSNTAIALAKEGHTIYVIKNEINKQHLKFKALATNGINLISLKKKKSGSRLVRVVERGLNILIRIYKKITPSFKKLKQKKNPLLKILIRINPNLLILSQGDNFDGLSYAFDAMQEKIPYITIAQKAKETSWPYQFHRKVLLETLKNAKYCLFVSKHNLNLTEEQFGFRFTNAQIVQNPIKIKNQIPYPIDDTTYNLLCVARYYLLDKGQDILIRILSKEPWKTRPIHISFVGSGPDKQALIELAKLLNVNNISFLDYVEDIESLWQTHHALILPSRNEGMPLSILEAMAIARPVIASNAGGNAEIVENNRLGFIGEANETDFEKAMENAWNKRDEWETIGINGSNYINNFFLKQPNQDLHKIISDYLNEA